MSDLERQEEEKLLASDTDDVQMGEVSDFFGDNFPPIPPPEASEEEPDVEISEKQDLLESGLTEKPDVQGPSSTDSARCEDVSDADADFSKVQLHPGSILYQIPAGPREVVMVAKDNLPGEFHRIIPLPGVDDIIVMYDRTGKRKLLSVPKEIYLPALPPGAQQLLDQLPAQVRLAEPAVVQSAQGQARIQTPQPVQAPAKETPGNQPQPSFEGNKAAKVSTTPKPTVALPFVPPPRTVPQSKPQQNTSSVPAKSTKSSGKKSMKSQAKTSKPSPGPSTGSTEALLARAMERLERLEKKIDGSRKNDGNKEATKCAKKGKTSKPQGHAKGKAPSTSGGPSTAHLSDDQLGPRIPKTAERFLWDESFHNGARLPPSCVRCGSDSHKSPDICPKPETCKYFLCKILHVQDQHCTSMCPEILQICGKCKVRGHREGAMCAQGKPRLERYFERVANRHRYLQFRRRIFSWGYHYLHDHRTARTIQSKYTYREWRLLHPRQAQAKISSIRSSNY